MICNLFSWNVYEIFGGYIVYRLVFTPFLLLVDPKSIVGTRIYYFGKFLVTVSCGHCKHYYIKYNDTPKQFLGEPLTTENCILHVYTLII